MHLRTELRGELASKAALEAAKIELRDHIDATMKSFRDEIRTHFDIVAESLRVDIQNMFDWMKAPPPPEARSLKSEALLN